MHKKVTDIELLEAMKQMEADLARNTQAIRGRNTSSVMPARQGTPKPRVALWMVHGLANAGKGWSCQLEITEAGKRHWHVVSGVGTQRVQVEHNSKRGE